MKLIIFIISMIFASEVDLQIQKNGNSNCIVSLDTKQTIYGIQMSIHYNSNEISLNSDAFFPMSDNIKFYKSFHKDGVVELLILDFLTEVLLDTAISQHIDLINISFQAKGEFKGTSIVKFADIAVAGKGGLPIENQGNSNHFIKLSFDLPISTFLSYNYPNPFRDVTNINYALSDSKVINLLIYDSNGMIVRKLFEGFQEVGYYNIIWDGLSNDAELIPNGHYILEMSTYDFVDSITMILLK